MPYGCIAVVHGFLTQATGTGARRLRYAAAGRLHYSNVTFARPANAMHDGNVTFAAREPGCLHDDDWHSVTAARRMRDYSATES